MVVYAFDVDDTLEVSNGPVKMDDLVKLRKEGHGESEFPDEFRAVLEAAFQVSGPAAAVATDHLLTALLLHSVSTAGRIPRGSGDRFELGLRRGFFREGRERLPEESARFIATSRWRLSL